VGTLKQLVFRSYSRHRRRFNAGITLKYLDVSFLALSEDKFNSNREDGRKTGDSRYPYGADTFPPGAEFMSDDP
jgi:hypothetical protein